MPDRQVDEILEKHRHVMKYDTSKVPSDSVIDELLQRTWKVTPAKNQVMPYSVFVLGPKHQEYKDEIFRLCSFNEDEQNQSNPKEDVNKGNRKGQNYKNILTCSHLLIFTLRLNTKPNEFQKEMLAKGIYYDPFFEEGLEDSVPAISVECGIFSNTFRALCIDKGIDTSYTLNFPRKVSRWKNIPFVERKVLLMMTVGYKEWYRTETIEKFHLFGKPGDDLKPDYHEIVKFVE